MVYTISHNNDSLVVVCTLIHLFRNLRIMGVHCTIMHITPTLKLLLLLGTPEPP